MANIRKKRGPSKEALRKLQEIIEEAVDSGADSVTVEYAKEGGLEVYFQFGSTGVGGVLVDRALESAVMRLICERARLGEETCGTMHWTSRDEQVDIRVEEYDSFGETAFRLTLLGPKRRGS